MACYPALPEHHLVNFFANAIADGIQVIAACACGAKLACTGSDRSAASTELQQVFGQHKEDPWKESSGVQPPQQVSHRVEGEKKMPKEMEKDTRKKVKAYVTPDLPLYHALRGRQPSELPRSLDRIGKWEDISHEQLAQIATSIQYCQTNLSRAARELGICRQTLVLALHKAHLSTEKTDDLRERFWHTILFSEESTCWIWNGPLISGLPYLRLAAVRSMPGAMPGAWRMVRLKSVRRCAWAAATLCVSTQST